MDLKRLHFISAISFISVFVIIHLFLVWDGGVNGVFNSPDANANYYFSKQIYEGESFSYQIPYEDNENNAYISTRSTRVIGDKIVPVSFFGMMIMYGGISKLLFANLISYLTVIFSGLGLLYLYLLVNRIAGSQIGFITTVLTSIHPAYWYYTNESLFPNVLFVSFVIAGFYYAIEYTKKHRNIDLAFLVASLCIALVVRTSEVIWIAPLILMFIYFERKKLLKNSWRTIVWTFTISIVAVVLIKITILHSAPLFAYVLPKFSNISSYLLPFGFHPRLIGLNFYNYALELFWPFTIFSAIGFFAMYLRRKTTNLPAIKIIIISLLISILIVLFYGSWLVIDHPDASAVTIGNSFVRYFMPIYILGNLFIAYAISLIPINSKRIKAIIITVIITLLSIFSLRMTIYDSDEGWIAKRKILGGYDTISTWIRKNSEHNALFITNTSDKYIWPHRMVMQVPIDKNGLTTVSYFINNQEKPVYFIGLTMSKLDMNNINEFYNNANLFLQTEIYSHAGLSIYPIKTVND